MIVITTTSNHYLVNIGISKKSLKHEVIKTSLLIYFSSLNDFIKLLTFV